MRPRLNLINLFNPINYNPFSDYPLDVVVQKNENDFVFRKFPNVLIEITGYGTESPIFRCGNYDQDHPELPINWFPLPDREIKEIIEKLPKFNAESLENICIKYINNNLSKFNCNIDIEPLELPEKFKDVNLFAKQHDLNLALNQLNEKLNQLTRESWKCFGLKLTVPLIPLLLISLVTISIRTKDIKKTEPNIKTLSFAGSGVLGFFGAVIGYSKEKHQQQKEIDKTIESTKHQIATMRRQP